MTEDKPYNKFIKKPTNSNILINVTLVIGFIILIVSQVSLFNYMTQARLRASNPNDLVQDQTGSQNLTLTSNDIVLTSCEDDDLANAIAIIRPSIVNIDVVKSNISSQTQRGGRPSTVFDVPSDQALSSDAETLGSGIIVSKNGYILTCYHLIKDSPNVYATVFSAVRKQYKAEIIIVDEENDLVLLKIEADNVLPPATLGNSDLIKNTDIVLAIGSPYGFEHTVTRGIISDNKRDMIIDGRLYTDLFQTDAAINRGSAGGALLSSAGEVIGINTAIVSESEDFIGISFAVPINKARPLLIKAMFD